MKHTLQEPPHAPLVWRLGMTRGALVAVGVLTAAVVGGFFRVEQLARSGSEAHRAICIYRADLAQRVQASRDFLKTHPRGIPGIPPSVIRNSINNQQRTVDSLMSLRCP